MLQLQICDTAATKTALKTRPLRNSIGTESSEDKIEKCMCIRGAGVREEGGALLIFPFLTEFFPQ